MKKLFCLLLIVAVASSCKKDAPKVANGSQNIVDLNSSLLNFSVNGQLLSSNIDTVLHTITVVVPRNADRHQLAANFVLKAAVSAKINNVAVSSGAALDLSQPTVFTLVAADQKSTLSFTIDAQTDIQYMGVRGNILASKSLNRSFNYYMDQWDGSTYQSINCGPTTTTMALRWADSTFGGKPVDARNLITENGGWWFTGDAIQYLHLDGVNARIDTLDNVSSVVKSTIDAGNVIILCLDMYYIQPDFLPVQHVEKFYAADNLGWGHFILVKGYIQTDANFYLETYDPYSDNATYTTLTPGQLKGQDRYYIDYDIKLATKNWWPYAILVAPKGKSVLSAHLNINSLHAPVPPGSGR